MFVDESLWIRSVLERAPLPAGSAVLDIGSSTEMFRTRTQAHIDANVFGPLRARGLAVDHLDARAEPGVTIVSDVTALAGVERLYDLVICSNLLEHVVERELVVRNVKRVVAPGGLLVISVPRRYPIHRDPIDTGFRPSVEELVALVGFPKLIDAQLVTVRSPRHYAGLRWPRRWLRPWQVACALLENAR